MNMEKFLSICRRSVVALCAVFVAVLSVGTPSAKADFEPITDYFYSSETWSNSTYPLMAASYECDPGVYMFRFSPNNGDDCLYAISETQNSEAFCRYYVNWEGNVVESDISITCSSQLGEYWYGYGATGKGFRVVSGEEVTNYCPRGRVGYVPDSVVADDFAAFLGEQQPPVETQFEIPAGHVAYFRANGNVTFTCQQNVFSVNSSTPWPETRQYWGSSNSLPASGTTFPISGSSLIPWQRGGSPDILGRTKTSVYTATSGPVYTYVFNQLINYLSSDDPYDYRPNGTIYVKGNISEFRLYSLSMSYDSSGGVAGYLTATSSSLDGYTDPGLGFVDPETGAVYYEHEDGSVYVPSVGGDNYMPESTTSEGFLAQVVGILKELLSSIGNLFGFAYEAIVSLVSLASPFISKLGALYSWLPSPVYAALTSAMVLAITIGVLKSFL